MMINASFAADLPEKLLFFALLGLVVGLWQWLTGDGLQNRARQQGRKSAETKMRKAKAMNSDQAEPANSPPDLDDFNTWFSIVCNPNHVPAELGAIVQGWKGAVAGSPASNAMSIDAAASRLGDLGFSTIGASIKANRTEDSTEL